MNISEAITISLFLAGSEEEKRNCIARGKWRFDQAVLPMTKGCCLLIERQTELNPVKWIPNAQDLTADDWRIIDGFRVSEQEALSQMKKKREKRFAQTVRVIKIINEKQIVLNVGSESEEAAHYGDIFEIFEESRTPLTDPFNGKQLGKPLICKEIVTPNRIGPEFCICRKVFESPRNPGQYCSLELSEHYTRKPQMNVRTEDISGGFDDNSTEIKVGDFARKVTLMPGEGSTE